jgi:hypothetical protein
MNTGATVELVERFQESVCHRFVEKLNNVRVAIFSDQPFMHPDRIKQEAYKGP